MISVYVGREGGRFLWQPSPDAHNTCNLPPAIGPWLPYLGGYGAFSAIVDRIESGAYAGQQVDWGAWAAKVSRAELIEFLDEFYSEEKLTAAASLLPHLVRQFDAFRQMTSSLEESEYLLVAVES